MSSGKFLFVPTSYNDDRQKELVYAACKAHTTRAAHQRRKQLADRRQGPSRNPHEIDYIQFMRAGSVHTTIHRHTSELNEQNRPDGRIIVCPKYAELRDRIVPLYQNDIPPDVRGSILSPCMLQAVTFTRFHLAKSWSPTFMLRLIRRNMVDMKVEDTFTLMATQWLWHIWTSKIAIFWSVVVSVIPIMIPHLPASQTKEMETMALELKTRNLSGLRSMLKDTVAQSDTELLTTAYYVKSVFREACASGDTSAASCHSQMLTLLVAKLAAHDSSVECRRLALWGDALPALLQLRRPAMDFSIGMNQLLENIWAAAGPMIPETRLVDLQPPNCIISEPFREALIHLRKALYIINVSMVAGASQQLARTELLFQWFITKAEQHICRLLNLYHDIITHADEPKPPEDTLTEGERYIQASLALALLYIYQKSFFDLYRYDGTDINESAYRIQPALKKTLQLARNHCSRSEQLFYQNAIFWIVFVGAWAEQRIQITPSQSATTHSNSSVNTNTWFSEELLNLAVQHDLSSWPKTRKVLYAFAWSDLLEVNANAEKWYNELVHAGKQRDTIRLPFARSPSNGQRAS